MNDCASYEVGAARAAAKVSPLHQLKAGRTARVREVRGEPDISVRLREIGFHEGQVIRLIACHTHIVCQVSNARLALNSALARCIFVEAMAE